MDKKKLVRDTKAGLMAALSMPGVQEWANEVDLWMSENREEAREMGEELASARRVFDEIIEKVVASYDFPVPPRRPLGLLNGFCSSFSESFDEKIDVSKEVGVATIERFVGAVRRGMEK